MKPLFLIAMLFAISAIGLAQGHHGQHTGGSAANGTLDMTKVQTVTGTVSAVNIGYGMEYPSIVVNKVQIKVAPVWYLLEKEFEIKVGDSASLSAAPSTSSTTDLHAIAILNYTSKLQITLRDAAGVPAWAINGGGGGVGQGQFAQGGGCLDVATIATVTGTIETLNLGLGIQQPTLTLKKADGSLLNLKLGPERILLAADVELKVGDKITVRYAADTCRDELVALLITTASGPTIRLRNDDCIPAW